LTWLTWFMAACAAGVALVLARALGTGELWTHKGPDLHRAEHPRLFWIAFASYVLILLAAIWAAVRW
jgi:hypothetical protein